MMDNSLAWLTLGVLSALSFSFINLADRKFLHSLNAHPIVYPAFATTLGTLFTAVFSLVFINDSTVITASQIWWGILIGIISLVGSGLFYFALSCSEVSKIIGFDRIKLVIVLIIAILVFDEPFSWWIVLGAGLIVIGSVAGSIPQGKWTPRFELGAALMFASGVIGALDIIPQKLGVLEGSPIILALVASATRSTFFVAIALLFRREQFRKLQKQLQHPKMFGALLLRSFVSATGWTSYYYALSLGFIYQITGIGQIRPALVTVLAWIFLKEIEPQKRLLTNVIIVIGALCIVLSFP